jgi:hypothetical protein
MASVRYVDTLRLLITNEVELIVVGMAAGVLHGAPAFTQDLDIVHRRTPENVQRLLRVLRSIHAVARHDDRNLEPGPSHLLGPGHILLSTDNGDLDCLGQIDGDSSFEELLPHSTVIRLDDDLQLRVVNLDRLIEIKRRAGRPKDLAVIPVLEATLAEQRQRA